MGKLYFVSQIRASTKTGTDGLNSAQMEAAYWAVSWAQNTAYLELGAYQGYQKWTVPETGNYRIEALGVAGGAALGYPPSYFGRGAKVKTDISLIQGESIAIIVGQLGFYAPYYEGGGTFVIRLSDGTALAVAGGVARQNQDNRTNTNASIMTSAKPYYYNPAASGAPGAGGFLGNGINSQYNGKGARGYPNGLVGCAAMNGDAGAGGCGDGIYWGGSGNAGGYSGGAS